MSRNIFRWRFLKNLLYMGLCGIVFHDCHSSQKTFLKSTASPLQYSKQNDTIHISNESLEYEIIIIEPGFHNWLESIARPEGYYSQSFLENRNALYVIEWNQRVFQPQRFDASLYELQIDYQQNIDYGYEVNYRLYNYFIYFQLKYNQRLGPFTPRI